MSTSKASFLFIPDISGFTEFVNSTEIDHSQHIISELLENIIDSNEIDLVLAEIEGDAVLFYKHNQVPTVEKIIQQSQKMFLNFHNYLKTYEKQRICNCGACISAPNLKIKFIAHQGEIGFINVKNIKKPHGFNVVLIHKLLKNNLDNTEYLLITENFKDFPKQEELSQSFDWVELAEGKSQYDKIGEVGYHYIPLKPLYPLVSLPEIPAIDRMNNPIVMETYMDRPTNYVFQFLIRLELRANWNKDLKDIEFEEGRINQIGDKHICVLDSGRLEIETVSGEAYDEKLTYGERIINSPSLMKDLSTYYIIEKQGEGSKVTLEVHYKPLPWIGGLLDPLIRRMVTKNLNNALKYLKDGVEQYKGELLVSA